MPGAEDKFVFDAVFCIKGVEVLWKLGRDTSAKV